MTPRQTVAVIAFLASVNPAMKVLETTAEAWHSILNDLDGDDVLEAAKRCAGRQTWVSAADVRQEARRIVRDRVERSDPLALPDADPDDVPEWLRALRQGRHREVGELKPRPVLKALGAGMFHGVDEDGAA